MIEIPRHGQDDLVPFVQQAGDGGAEGLVTASGDGHLFRRNSPLIQGGAIAGDLIAQRGQAQNRPIQMRLRLIQRDIGHRLTQGQGRRINRGGL